MSQTDYLRREITQASEGDCLTAALASILDCDQAMLPTIDHEEGWLDRFNAKLAQSAQPVVLLDSPTAVCVKLPGLWIGVVPSLSQPHARHAVVMQGPHLAHDPGRRERYEWIDPRIIKCGLLPVLLAPPLMLADSLGQWPIQRQPPGRLDRALARHRDVA